MRSSDRSDIVGGFGVRCSSLLSSQLVARLSGVLVSLLSTLLLELFLPVLSYSCCYSFGWTMGIAIPACAELFLLLFLWLHHGNSRNSSSYFSYSQYSRV